MLHEALDAVLHAVARVAHAGADHGLQVEGQAFLGAAGDVVKVEAHGPEEVPRPADRARFLRCQQAAAGTVLADQLRHALHAEGMARQPVERLQVAQPATAFLDMRLHQEGAVAVARMTRGALVPLGDEEGGQAGLLAEGAEGRVELVEDRAVPREVAGIDQGGLDGDVALRIIDAFADGAGRMADLQPEVPEQVEHELHRPPPLRAERRIRQEQQVDIGIGREHAPAIAAGGDQGEVRLCLRVPHGRDHGQGIGMDRAHHPVGQRRQPSRGGEARKLMRLEGALDLALDAAELAAQLRQGGVARGRLPAFPQGGDQVWQDLRVFPGGRTGCIRRVGEGDPHRGCHDNDLRASATGLCCCVAPCSANKARSR